MVCSIIGLGLNDLFVWLITDICHVYYMISKVIATVFVMIFNFVTRKKFLEQEDIMQVVYHGSYIKADNPKILIGQFTKDFGNGFYCTILKEQARKWSQKYKSSVVNIYEYHENKSNAESTRL